MALNYPIINWKWWEPPELAQPLWNLRQQDDCHPCNIQEAWLPSIVQTEWCHQTCVLGDIRNASGTLPGLRHCHRKCRSHRDISVSRLSGQGGCLRYPRTAQRALNICISALETIPQCLDASALLSPWDPCQSKSPVSPRWLGFHRAWGGNLDGAVWGSQGDCQQTSGKVYCW